MSADDVNTLISITGAQITTEQATHILKLFNNRLDTAVDKCFDEGGIPELLARPLPSDAWDSSAFDADRYGENGGSGNIPTFSIDYAPGVEHYPHSGGPSGAPTRPSSRTSHRSNVSTHAGDAPRQSVETGQESGLVGTSATVFGPANQHDAYYDNASWAMVPVSKSTEYIPDASQWFQSRSPDTPAFLKPATSDEYLPAMLTILHSIPLFRNALLMPNVTADNYDSGSEWWKGNAEAQAFMVDNDAGSGSTTGLEFVYETQRLMSFLDNTERAYASLDTLFQLEAWKKPRLSPEEPEDLDDDLVKFLLRWTFVYKKHHPDAILDGVFRSTIIPQGRLQKSFVLDLPAVPDPTTKDLRLYDLMDAALFESADHSAFIQDASDVLILRLNPTRAGARVDCKIPPFLRASRYLEQNKSEVEQMFAQKRRYVEDIQKIDAQVERLKFHRPQKPNLPEKMDTLQMIKKSMDAFDPEKEDEEDKSAHAAVVAQLKTLYGNIEGKLNSLEEEKKKARDALDDVSASFRASVDVDEQVRDANHQGFAKYLYQLQGVATSSTDFYILHPKAEPSKDDEAAPPQWWHIKYNYASDSATIDRNQVSIEQVCEEASAITGKTLLIYANDAALSAPQIPLSKPLEDFVKLDNLALHRDIKRQEDTGWGGHDAREGSHIVGDWAEEGARVGEWNDGFDDWNSISAKEFHQSGYGSANGGYVDANDGGSGISSSRTLTPNTEVDDDELLRSDATEMQEVNGGKHVGLQSNASSETVGLEPMEIVKESQKSRGEDTDVEMMDADTQEVKAAVKDMGSEVVHIERVEKKDG
ncbi:hypothetical protein P280DRAFT_471029 [Massarina eburnea CBS 473.64]|uniref:Ubiquitin interaction motif protein n=1 Tax=Massarina eburnea CBS 473.64 TaxID=1395130 RepID=A0A6A6RUR2_9PLEO|nr:hypothetical protein P280DRAFT_471029 [Massarina eburnea CBS 473.64]